MKRGEAGESSAKNHPAGLYQAESVRFKLKRAPSAQKPLNTMTKSMAKGSSTPSGGSESWEPKRRTVKKTRPASIARPSTSLRSETSLASTTGTTAPNWAKIARAI